MHQTFPFCFGIFFVSVVRTCGGCLRYLPEPAVLSQVTHRFVVLSILRLLLRKTLGLCVEKNMVRMKIYAAFNVGRSLGVDFPCVFAPAFVICLPAVATRADSCAFWQGSSPRLGSQYQVSTTLVVGACGVFRSQLFVQISCCITTHTQRKTLFFCMVIATLYLLL